jgi:SAM-dependent methyltransferase
MAKTGEIPPEEGFDPAATVVTPRPEVVSDELGEDTALEWSITEFTGEVLTEPALPQLPDGLRRPPIQAGDGAARPVLRWPETPGPTDGAVPSPSGDDIDAGKDTPPAIPIGPPSAGHDNGTKATEPLRLADHAPPGALPARARELAPTPLGGSDEDLVILEPPPVPVVPLVVPAAPPALAAVPLPEPAGDRPRTPVTRARTPPPLPSAVHAASASLLLPDIPVELIGGAAPEAWPEALAPRPRKKRLRPWFEEVFDEDYLRTLPFMTAEQTLREVAFIREALGPVTDGQILDVACGYGRHAIELSQRGLRVTGLDLSLPLLIRAADESQRRALSVNFVHADMREMVYDGEFDGAYCILSSFGYFDEETNLRVATSICRALKPGARFLLDTLNRDYIVSDLPARVWWEGDGCVVLEEVDFNFHTSRMIIRRSVVFQDGRQVEQDISIRAYSLHELGKLFRQAGFRVLDVSGSLATKGTFFGSTSRNIIMVCERPDG